MTLQKNNITSFIHDQLNSRFNQDVIWNILSLIVMAVGGMFINLIILREMGDAALGIFNQIYSIYLVTSQISVMGIHFSVLNHISHNQDEQKKCVEISTSAILIVIITSLIIGTITWALSPLIARLLQSAEVSTGLRLVIIGLPLFSINKVLINILNGLSKMRAYAIFRTLRYGFIPIWIGIFIYLQYSAAYMALAFTLSELLLFIFMFIYVWLKVFPLFDFSNITFWIKKHVTFGLKGMFSGVMLEFNSLVNILILGYFASDATVGIYSFAATVSEGFAQIPMAVRWTADPIIGNYFSKDLKSDIEVLSRKIRKALYPIMLLITIVSLFVYPILYRLLIGTDENSISWIVFSLIMVGVLINSGYRPMSGILVQGSKPGSYTILILSLLFIDIILNIILIPVLGIYGAALVAALIYILEAIFIFIAGKKIFNIKL